MAESHVALALALGLTGAGFPNGSGPHCRFGEVSGEVRVEAPKRAAQVPMPEIASGSRITVLTGSARVDCDLPATLWLERGDEAKIAAIGTPGSAPAVMFEAIGERTIGLEAGQARMLLESGQAVIVRRTANDRMALEIAAGDVEVEGLGWSDVLAPGEMIALHAEPPGYLGQPVEMGKLTSARITRGREQVMTLRSPQVTLAEATAVEEDSEWGKEPDLRSAVGAKRETTEGGVEADRLTAALMALTMVMAAWWWSRRFL
ncbi:MAG: hypothetical protein HY553_16015 [Elusimicrobia bacterium]|nr:hypothetical protein [Elusimicrobiota bacterium]